MRRSVPITLATPVRSPGRDSPARFSLRAPHAGGSAKVQGITTAEYPTLARRPANSLLSHDAITRDYGIRPQAWQMALSIILDELIDSLAKETQP